MRRMVVDSNALQSPDFKAYLSESTGNYAVFCDYVAMEAYKGDTFASIFRSMDIATQFPRQIIILKSTGRVCALSGRMQGLQRRMIEERQTQEFSDFSRKLAMAQSGNRSLQDQIAESGRVASAHLERMLDDAGTIHSAIKEVRSYFTPEELKAIRLDTGYSPESIEKSLKFIVDLTFTTMKAHPSPPRKILNNTELKNTFLFRHSVATFVWTLDWIAKGGADGVRADRMRNDMVDVVLATYSTYFDGLLSRDAKGRRTYQRTKAILANLRG